jgi:hypothetical protein
MEILYVLGGMMLAYPAYKMAQGLRGLLSRSTAPLLLYHKPTGKLISIPREYESDAVDHLIADLKSLPRPTPINSPDFQVL